MKKIVAILLTFGFLCSFLFAGADIFLGGVYDSYSGNDWGLEGSIDADFLRDASLSAAVDYRNGSNYSMSFTADYKPSFFILGGGLDFKINKNGVYPGLKADMGFYYGEKFLLLAYGTLGINASNVRAPTMFEVGVKSKIIMPYVALQLNGFFSQERDTAFSTRNIFADISMTLYSEGFLYSLKAGAQGEYEYDTRWKSYPHHLSLKGIVGVGKNKSSGTFVVQFSFSVATLMGPKVSGFSISLGKFIGKTAYIF